MSEYDYKQLKACGTDVFISGNVEIRRPQLVSVGNHVAIDSGFYCTTALEVGDYSHIGPYICIIGGAEGVSVMKHFTTVSAGSRLLCVSDEFLGAGLVSSTIPEGYQDNRIKGPIVMEMFSNIGANSVVFPGVVLAEGSVLGACSMLTENTEPWTIYVGVPARPLKTRRKDLMKEKAKQLGYE
jgi:acetyltransferase-like isoleucine patch superfamily enzyme